MGGVTLTRTWVRLLGAIGVGSMIYVLVARIIAADGQELGGHGSPANLGWPLLTIVPMLGLGLWLASVSSSRQGLYVLLSGSGMAASSAYETVVLLNPGLPASPAFALINGVGLTADALSGIGGALSLGAFPDGTLERP
jgi:hypothetical protein